MLNGSTIWHQGKPTGLSVTCFHPCSYFRNVAYFLYQMPSNSNQFLFFFFAGQDRLNAVNMVKLFPFTPRRPSRLWSWSHNIHHLLSYSLIVRHPPAPAILPLESACCHLSTMTRSSKLLNVIYSSLPPSNNNWLSVWELNSSGKSVSLTSSLTPHFPSSFGVKSALHHPRKLWLGHLLTVVVRLVWTTSMDSC